MKKLLILSIGLLSVNAFALDVDHVRQGLQAALDQGAHGTYSVLIKQSDGSLKQINRMVYEQADCVLQPSQSCTDYQIVIEAPQI